MKIGIKTSVVLYIRNTRRFGSSCTVLNPNLGSVIKTVMVLILSRDFYATKDRKKKKKKKKKKS